MLADFSGLNLTMAALSASRKYLAQSDEISEEHQAFKKLGFFQSEKELIEMIERETGAIRARHPITYIVEAADDIVYSAIDLEDALKKRIIDWPTIKNELSPWCGDIIKKAEKNIYDRAVKQDFHQLPGGSSDFAKVEFKELRGQALSEARMNLFRTLIISSNIDGVVEEFKSNYSLIIKGEFKGELINNKTIRDVIEKCKGIAGKYVFPNQEILKLEIMGRNIIHDLMDSFWEGISQYPYEDKKHRKKHPFNFKTYSLLSENYKTVFEADYASTEDKKRHNYAKLQFLADYICGMTDSFARELHMKLRNG
jgi:dGTPase